MSKFLRINSSANVSQITDFVVSHPWGNWFKFKDITSKRVYSFLLLRQISALKKKITCFVWFYLLFSREVGFDSFATPWTIYSQPDSSVCGISQVKILELVAISFSRDLPNSGIEPTSPALADGFFATESPGKPWFYLNIASSVSHVYLFSFHPEIQCAIIVGTENNLSVFSFRIYFSMFQTIAIIIN